MKHAKVHVSIPLKSRADLKEFSNIFFGREYDWSNIEPKIIFDLGSNIGFTLAYFRLRYPEARLFGFEPNPEAYARAAELFKGDAQVEVIQAAISDKEGAEPLYMTGHLSSSSLVRRPGSKSSIEVKTMTLAAACAQLGLEHIDFMKFDIEGAEDRALVGSPALRSTDRIAGEVHEDLMGMSLGDFLEGLRMAGFSIVSCEPLAPGKPRYLLRARRLELVH